MMIKKITRLSALFMLALVSFTACKNAGSEPEILERGSFKLMFGASQMSAKAASTEAKAWEKKLVSVTLFVYKTSDAETVAPVYTHIFSTAEISKMQSVFSITGITAATGYDFYVVANKTYTDPSTITREELKKETELLEEGSPATDKYNDADYVNMTDATKAATKYANGFLMTGMQQATSPAMGDNKPTTVEVALTRPVVKVEVNSKISQKFIDKYGKGNASGALGGTLKITKVEIVDVPKSGLLVKPTTMPTFSDDAHLTTINQTNTTTFAQTTENDATNSHKNLFYYYENQIAAAGSPKKQPELRIYAEYTFDGGSHTTKITYKRLLGGEGTLDASDDKTGKGVFLRNSLYIVNATINGLTPEEVVATIKVEDWATATTQNIGFGGE